LLFSPIPSGNSSYSIEVREEQLEEEDAGEDEEEDGEWGKGEEEDEEGLLDLMADLSAALEFDREDKEWN
jgi:hypothetical protein